MSVPLEAAATRDPRAKRGWRRKAWAIAVDRGQASTAMTQAATPQPPPDHEMEAQRVVQLAPEPRPDRATHSASRRHS